MANEAAKIQDLFEQGLEVVQTGLVKDPGELERILRLTSLRSRDAVLLLEYSPSANQHQYTLLASREYPLF